MARQAPNDPQLEEFSRVQEWLRAETERWRTFPCGTLAHCQERQRALQELQQRTRILKRDLVAYLRARKRRKGSEGSGTWAAVLISALLGIGLWLLMVLGCCGCAGKIAPTAPRAVNERPVYAASAISNGVVLPPPARTNWLAWDWAKGPAMFEVWRSTNLAYGVAGFEHWTNVWASPVQVRNLAREYSIVIASNYNNGLRTAVKGFTVP